MNLGSEWQFFYIIFMHVMKTRVKILQNSQN